ncbi:MAG: DUF1638 domain-containing protein [Actinomycetota bacterium]
MTAVPSPPGAPDPARTLILGCGALAAELLELVRVNNLSHVTVDCLPASLHHKPALIAAALNERLERLEQREGPAYQQILIGYGDCGTAGAIDRVCDRFGATRLPGAHCFEFFAGAEVYGALQEAELGTFYLTDFFARHFKLFVLDALGMVAHPELIQLYFGNYTRVVYISQAPSPDLLQRAEDAATHLGLTFEHRPVGYGDLGPVFVGLGER